MNADLQIQRSRANLSESSAKRCNVNPCQETLSLSRSAHVPVHVHHELPTGTLRSRVVHVYSTFLFRPTGSYSVVVPRDGSATLPELARSTSLHVDLVPINFNVRAS